VAETSTRLGRRGALHELHWACKDNDPLRARNALLAWAATFRPDDPPSLATLSCRADTRLAKAIAELNRAIYANDGQPWHGEELWQTVRATGPEWDAPKLHRSDALPPLYES